MDPAFEHCLRLDDDVGAKRWLATRSASWRLRTEGGYECERVRLGSLECNLRRLVDRGNSSWGLLGFITRCESGFGPGDFGWLRDGELVPAVLAAIDAGRLVVIRESGPATANPADQARAEALRIAREVDRLTKGRLRCNGRRYTLCAPGHIDRTALGLTQRMLLPREAVTVLDRMIEEHAAVTELVAHLREARAFFSAGDRRAGGEPELVLLRHLVVPRAPVTEQAPATPSQLKQEMHEKIKLTLEVVVLDSQDRPWPGLEYEIQTPDGETVSGSLGGAAKTRAISLKPGTAAVVLTPAESKRS